MVENEEDTVKQARHAPQRQQSLPPQRRLQNNRRQVSTSSSRRVAPQSRLHNFSFPSMSWGNQRLLRCAKVESHGVRAADPREIPTSPLLPDRGSGDAECGRMRRVPDHQAAEGEEEVEEEEDERLNKFRDAMMAEFRKAFDRIPLPSPQTPAPQMTKGMHKEEKEKSPSAEGSRPWNLRIRRAACNAPSATDNYSLRSDASQPKEGRPKFFSVLSKEEMAEDFFAMTGSKLPRRPKKRPRNVQRQLEGIFPGSYLTEVTPDLYKITEDK